MRSSVAFAATVGLAFARGLLEVLGVAATVGIAFQAAFLKLRLCEKSQLNGRV